MCYIDEYEKDNQSSSCDNGISGRVCPIPSNSTTEAL